MTDQIVFEQERVTRWVPLMEYEPLIFGRVRVDQSLIPM